MALCIVRTAGWEEVLFQFEVSDSGMHSECQVEIGVGILLWVTTVTTQGVKVVVRRFRRNCDLGFACQHSQHSLNSMPVACQKRLGSMNVNKCQQPTKFVLPFRLLFIALVAGILMTLFALN